MTCHSWNKESALLFDFESKDVTVSNVTISSPGYVLKNGNKIVFKRKIDKFTYTSVGEISLSKNDFFFKFEEENKKTIDEKNWLVIKNMFTLEKYGYKLREGDIIKLGKVLFKIRELKSGLNINEEKKITLPNENQENQFETHLNVNITPDEIKKEKSKKTKLPACRICLMDDNEEENPLINPCNCIGSVRFIHLQCIKHWLKSKINSQTLNFITVHSFKNFECEICKASVPERMKYKSSTLTLIEFPKPESSYIMLESISREKKEMKFVYIIHLKDKKEILLGRSNEADVRMTDISVSRSHASIKLVNGKFYIDDTDSKFGTLAQIQNDVVFLPNKIISLQCGKLHMFFYLCRTCFAWLRCYSNKCYEKLDYNDILENKILRYHQNEIEKLKNVCTEYSMGDEPIIVSGLNESDIKKTINNNEINESNCEVECEGTKEGEIVIETHPVHNIKPVLTNYNTEQMMPTQFNSNEANGNTIVNVNATSQMNLNSQINNNKNANNNGTTMNVSDDLHIRPISGIYLLNNKNNFKNEGEKSLPLSQKIIVNSKYNDEVFIKIKERNFVKMMEENEKLFIGEKFEPNSNKRINKNSNISVKASYTIPKCEIYSILKENKNEEKKKFKSHLGLNKKANVTIVEMKALNKNDECPNLSYSSMGSVHKQMESEYNSNKNEGKDDSPVNKNKIQLNEVEHIEVLPDPKIIGDFPNLDKSVKEQIVSQIKNSSSSNEGSKNKNSSVSSLSSSPSNQGSNFITQRRNSNSSFLSKNSKL